MSRTLNRESRGHKYFGNSLLGVTAGMVAMLGITNAKNSDELRALPEDNKTEPGITAHYKLPTNRIVKITKDAAVKERRLRQEAITRQRRLRQEANIAKWSTMSLAELTPAQEVAIITEEDMSAWSKVAVCEQGGDWTVSGSKFSGGLGIMNSNWDHYGRGDFDASASTATPKEQVVVARRILEENGLSRAVAAAGRFQSRKLQVESRKSKASGLWSAAPFDFLPLTFDSCIIDRCPSL
jgi:hypothetical protein